MKEVYIASKPMQYIICEKIAKLSNLSSNKTLIIVDMFSNARSITRNIKNYGDIWSRVYWAKNRLISHLIAAAMAPNVLYIDGDIGVRLYLYILVVKILNPKCSICVYEEGVGTYRNDFYTSSYYAKFKKKAFTILGIGTYFGGSTFINSVYVYRPEYYQSISTRKNVKIQKIPSTFIDYCDENLERLVALFQSNASVEQFKKKHDHCLIYITDWHLRHEIIMNLTEHSSKSDVYIKPHPNIKENYQCSGLSIYKIDNAMPAEIFALKALAKYKHITVMHHGSSAEFYLQSKPITFIRLS